MINILSFLWDIVWRTSPLRRAARTIILALKSCFEREPQETNAIAPVTSYGLIRHGVKVSPPTLVRSSSVSLRNTSHVVTDTEVL